MNPPTPAAPSFYPDKLRDPRWMKRKAEILLKRGQHCQFCNGQTTFVRHIVRSEEDPWSYPDDHYQVICPPCLKRRQPVIDALINNLRMAIKDVHEDRLDDFVALARYELERLQEDFKRKAQS